MLKSLKKPLSCSRSDKFEVILGLRKDIFFSLRNPWEFEEWRSKMPIAQQEMSQPRGDWPRNIQWKILMKKAAKNWLITASLIWIDLLTSHEKWAERIPLSFCNDLSDIFASPRSRENWMPERPKLMTTGQHFWPGHKWQIASAFVSSSVSSASLICISFEELSLNSTSSVSKHKNELFFKALAADADHKDVKEHLFFSRVAKHSSSEVGGEKRSKLVCDPAVVEIWESSVLTLRLEARHVFLFSFK